MTDQSVVDHEPIDAPVIDPHETEPIHGFFGLTYSNYLVLHRTRLQSMPEQWQAHFVALMREMDAALGDYPAADAYNVEAGDWQCPEDLNDDERKTLGVTSSRDTALAEIFDEEETFHDANGNELDTGRGCVFVPGPEPTPHYDRGRTRLTPDLDAIQTHRRSVAAELTDHARYRARRALIGTRDGDTRRHLILQPGQEIIVQTLPGLRAPDDYILGPARVIAFNQILDPSRDWGSTPEHDAHYTIRSATPYGPSTWIASSAWITVPAGTYAAAP